MPELLKAILSAAGVLGIMGLLFGALLSLASKLFFVHEDERKPIIIEALPGANCGGCGYAGCSAYADAILEGKAAVNLCNVGGQTAADTIASAMGVEAGTVVKKYARVRCQGSHDLATAKYEYQGLDDCVAAARLLEGYMHCKYGCLGFGNCSRVCKNNAIVLENGVAKIDRSLCGGCGECANACPKNVIDILPEQTKYVVGCSSEEKGAKTKKDCLTGCLGCKICEKQCEFDAIHVENNLAHIDYDKCTSCGKCALKCPSKIILKVSE